jgi:hypothetical protein
MTASFSQPSVVVAGGSADFGSSARKVVTMPTSASAAITLSVTGHGTIEGSSRARASTIQSAMR